MSKRSRLGPRRVFIALGAGIACAAACRDYGDWQPLIEIEGGASSGGTEVGGAGGNGTTGGLRGNSGGAGSHAGSGGRPTSGTGGMALDPHSSAGMSGGAGVSGADMTAGGADTTAGGTNTTFGGADSGGTSAGAQGGVSDRAGSPSVDSGGNGGAGGVEHGGSASGGTIVPADDPVGPPWCLGYRGNNDTRIPTKPVKDLSVSNTPSGPTPYAVYGTVPSVDIVAAAWKVSPRLDDVWTQWTCHDEVIDPDRTAASNDGFGEVDLFVTSTSGRLYYRHQYKSIDWLAWRELIPPLPGSAIQDVASTGGPNLDGSHLYVVSRGQVFDRTKRTVDGKLVFDAWRAIGGASVWRLAALARADGRQALLALDRSGNLMLSWSTEKTFEAEPVWTALPELAGVVSVDLVEDDDARAVAYAVDEEGTLWTCRGIPSCSWSLRHAGAPRLVSISAGSFPGQPATLFGLDEAGTAYLSFDQGADAWNLLVK